MTRIYLSRADVTAVEEDLVVEALRSGWIAPLGPMVDRFEHEVAERAGVEHALALSSGTAALHLALLQAGAAPGRVVLLPSMTFAASANAVAYTGATPVFVDSAPDANVDVALLLEAIDAMRAEGSEIAAVMSVDLFGRCADYAQLVPALRERDITLIEDAAEALGASVSNGSAGSFGSAAALSFNGNKIMTTSGGGMLLSNDGELISRARYLSTQARQAAAWYEHTEVGYNYRMSNVLAALGLGQLSRLDTMIARRRQIRQRYVEAFAGLDGVRFLGRHDPRGDGLDNCWLTCIVLDCEIATDPDIIVKSLDEQGIEARHLWKPMHLQPLHASARMFNNGMSEALFRRGVTLPSGSGLADSEIDCVIEALFPLVSA